MPAWPSTLPQLVLTDGYQEQFADVVLRTEMDAGPAKQRRRLTAGVRPIRCVLLCTTAQVATLQSFYNFDLAGGALSFDWVTPRTEAAAVLRFTAPPEIVPEPGAQYWRIGLALETLP